MKIIAICDTNPFFVSSAYANRLAGLFKAVSSLINEFKLYVLSPCSEKELRENGLPEGLNGICVSYLSKTIDSDKSLFGRIKNILLGKRLNSEQRINIKKAYTENADVIWIAGGNAIRKAFLKNKKYITATTMMEMSEYQQLYKQEKMFFVQKLRFWLEYRTTCRALYNIDVLAVMTKHLEQYYQSYTSPKTKYIHLPMTVDLSRFSDVVLRDLPYEKPYIAFTGTYTDLKDGVSILIKSFASIAEKYPTYKLYLAGFYNPDMEKQVQLIKDLGLENRVKHIGILDKSVIPTFVKNASLLVLSRPDSRQAQGGFPTKLGEYLATGNPVCVTKVGEIQNYLEDNVSAFMADPGNVDSFADAMDRALRDIENAKRIGDNGRKVAEEHFNAEKQAKKLVDFLEANIH